MVVNLSASARNRRPVLGEPRLHPETAGRGSSTCSSCLPVEHFVENVQSLGSFSGLIIYKATLLLVYDGAVLSCGEAECEAELMEAKQPSHL